ncbi:hypothetical protein [Deinococcus multiflagellatus]|uniref:Uncharacterized protein n=2 Tax=Deinococcus multiflagellatus TaxID=1656887 RepID=A0ABW1ZHS4_9DEIO
MNARSTLSRLPGSVLSTLRQTLSEGAWDAPESEAARREGLAALTTFLLSARATLVDGEAQLVATGQQVANLYTVLSGLK